MSKYVVVDGEEGIRKTRKCRRGDITALQTTEIETKKRLDRASRFGAQSTNSPVPLSRQAHAKHKTPMPKLVPRSVQMNPNFDMAHYDSLSNDGEDFCGNVSNLIVMFRPTFDDTL